MNTKTYRQMYNRCQFGNLAANNQLYAHRLPRPFENKPLRQTDFNLFIQANYGRGPVYLKHGQVLSGACVLAPYQFTRGSLPSIVCSVVEPVETSGPSTGPSTGSGTDSGTDPDVELVETSYHLGMNAPLVNAGAAWVHSRKRADSTIRVSTQHLYVVSDILADYQSEEAFQAAAESYGALRTENTFLPPSEE